MREIKFRAWDNVVKEMSYSDGKFRQILYGGAGDDVAIGIKLHSSIKNWDKFSYGQRSIDEIIFMQFTGLKDKNGKEIYEGDVYRHSNNNYVVVWSENFGFILLALNDEWKSFKGILMTNHDYRGWNWIYRTKKHCEVIGNIYENKELLNEG